MTIMSKHSVTRRRSSRVIKDHTEEKHIQHDEDPDDVEVGYPPPTPPTTSKAQIYNQKDFAQVEHHVRQAPADIAEDFSHLLKYLCHDLESDLAKVRAIFCWIIHQKVPMLLNQKDIPPPDTPIGYLYLVRQKKGTYPELFSTMCRQSDVPCVVIHGLAKGVRYSVGDKLCTRLHKHSWNAVYLEGGWRLVNPHWAATSVDGYKCGPWGLAASTEQYGESDGDESSRSYIIHTMVNDFYFLTDPDKFITKCFPNNSHWQLLAHPLTKQQFEELPFLQPSFYELGLQLENHEQSTIHTKMGKVKVRIKMPEESHLRLQFTYNLFHQRDSNEEGETDDQKLERFILHYPRGQTAVFEIRFPPVCVGTYKLEVHCCDPERVLPADWICDFQIVCEQGMEECIPLPVVPRVGWGPGKATKTHGVRAKSHFDGVVCIDEDLFTCFTFEVDKTCDLHAELVHYVTPKSELMEYVECYKNEQEDTVVKVKAPSPGEFALQIFCREDGNLLYENICNYLLQRTILVENPSQAKIRERLNAALEAGDEEGLSAAMREFAEKGVDDKGDLTRAKRRFLLLRLNKEIKEALAARDLDKLERTMHGLSNTSLRRDLGAVMEDAEEMRSKLRKLKRLQLAVLQMDQKTISELRSYPKPPPAVHGVMLATFLLLGQKESEIKRWANIQGLISKRGNASLKKRVANFEGRQVKSASLRRAEQILDKYDLETVQIASAGAATFYQWATNMIHDIQARKDEASTDG